MTAQELKNSILQLAIQGKLVKQDPNDEPASILLEKIKEEREKLIKEKKIKREKYSEIYKDPSDNHYYEKFEDGTINDITEEIPFEIPDSWYFIRLNNLINYKIGKTPPRGEKSYWNNNYHWVSISDMIDGKNIKETKKMVSQKAYDEIFNNDISPKGTLIMSFKLTIGKVSILDMNSFHNEAIISIYPYFDNQNIIRDYLFKVLPLISNYGNTKNAIKGKTLNSKSINNLLIPITNLNEINKITNKIISLEPIIESYNNKFLKLEKLNNTYKEELKKSILQYAIQGKLVKQDPNDEPAEVLINKILEEKRELIKTKQIKKENLSVIYKDSTDNQFYEKFDDGKILNITNEIPFDIPDSWVWTRFKNICKVITCGYASTPKYEKDGIPFISAKNIKPYKFMPEEHKLISEELYKKLTTNFKPEFNDILLTRVGAGIGEAAIIDQDFDFAIYVSLTLIKLVNYNFICNKYILNYILSPFGVSTSLHNIYGKGASQGNLNVNNVRDFLVPIPSLNEQKKIVKKIETLFNIL